MAKSLTDITCTFAEFYAAIGKEASSIQLEEIHAVHQVLKKMLGRALVTACLALEDEKILHITLDNQKLPIPIHSVPTLAEQFHCWRQELIETATDEESSYRDRQKIKPGLVNLMQLDDKEAKQVCEQWARYPEQSEGYVFEGVTLINLQVNTQKTSCLTYISFRWQGQIIKCVVTESFWDEFGDEMEALLSASLHGNVHKLTIHVSGYRTTMGQYQEMELVSIEQS